MNNDVITIVGKVGLPRIGFADHVAFFVFDANGVN
jgi:hypothetical protein